MPIYEYECKKCGASFELLVRSDTELKCENCGSDKIEKKMSTFSAHEGGAKAPSCKCPGFDQGKCGSGMCGMG